MTSEHIDENVVHFQDEKSRRALTEAKRLSGLSAADWEYQLDGSAERLGIPPATLKSMITAIIKEREKAERADERKEHYAEKQQQREREREQARIDKEAEHKAKDKEKAFKALIKLPSDMHEVKLVELAKRLGDDLATLREEFSEYSGAEGVAAAPTTWDVEPWEEPVETAALLKELNAVISKYVAMRKEVCTAVVLWTAMSWVHNAIATHSPFLVATSAEPDFGKTTLLSVLANLVPKPFTGAEPTGASVYRVVDREKPTLIVDEADDLFARKSDVKHVFNMSWTRGWKIPRQQQGVTVWYDPFSPKIVGLLGLKLPPALRGRCIVVKLWPKKADEKVANFTYSDDEEFATLRRKLARWNADNCVAIKELNPLFPAGFTNRLQTNWRLLLAIAPSSPGTLPNGCLIGRTSAKEAQPKKWRV